MLFKLDTIKNLLDWRCYKTYKESILENFLFGRIFDGKGDFLIKTIWGKLTKSSRRAPPRGRRCTLNENTGSGEWFLLLSLHRRAWKGSGSIHSHSASGLKRMFSSSSTKESPYSIKISVPPLSFNLDKVDLIPPEKFVSIHKLLRICNRAQVKEAPLSYIKHFWVNQR